jgi:hypothetical protein
VIDGRSHFAAAHDSYLFERGGALTAFLNLDDYFSPPSIRRAVIIDGFVPTSARKMLAPGMGPARGNMQAAGLQRLKTSADLSNEAVAQQSL